ncbi:GGDEF domain-containing protein [Aquitalea sp.]|uniref:GGDEF domain-containing protein n=1 Tax=Aquitalea sp. TaxID=1872623 RepID=UPI0025907A71|nr:GGDEF domain-containing protein [Aquitalea sp.]
MEIRSTSSLTQPSTLPLPEILDSLVELTAQRERRTLEISLLATLRELMADCTIALYNCRWIDGHPWWRIQLDSLEEPPAQNQPWTLPGSKMLRILLQQDQHQAIHPIDTGLCVPLYQTNQVVAVLMVTPSAQAVVDHKLLIALARIHENFLNLLHASDSDTLTGLYNRRKFDSQLFSLVGDPSGDKRRIPLLALLDIDHFKQVNDNYGHIIGDEVLLMLAQRMQQFFGEDDGLYRYGGEEFAILFHSVSEEKAQAILEGFCTRISNHPFPQVGQVTVSIGFTRLDQGLVPAQVIDRADKALYYVKTHGRNQVYQFETLLRQGLVQEVEIASGDIDLF